MSTPTGAEVAVERVSKNFGRVTSLRDLSLHVSAGEAVAVTGRSGSGKSTLLAMIGGLEQPDSGRVLIDGRAIWTDSGNDTFNWSGGTVTGFVRFSLMRSSKSCTAVVPNSNFGNSMVVRRGRKQPDHG